jgi:hypothetical protein
MASRHFLRITGSLLFASVTLSAQGGQPIRGEVRDLRRERAIVAW